MTIITVTEGQDFELSESQAQRLRDAVERLRVHLSPRLTIFQERGSLFRLNNLIGTVDIGGGDLIEVSPKVATNEDWITATVSLLTGKEAIDIAGERQAGVSQLHSRLMDGIAAVYHQRLERAFRQEGPIVLLERMPRELPYLQGTLNITRWVQKVLWRPHIFPVSRVELAHDNPFTNVLVRVADTLAKVAVSPRVMTGLKAWSRNLSPGFSTAKFNPTVVAARALPEQWNAYKPAWSLAVAVLTKTSLFGPTGIHAGIGVAVEAWPLLETLLEKTLQAACRVRQNLEYKVKGVEQLLTPHGTPPQKSFSPVPDGRLFKQGNIIATFEAKYSDFNDRIPDREHIYQSLSTAAACGSTVAVLVYPGKFDPQTWEVHGFNGNPRYLIAIGLDMFTWLPPSKIDARGRALLNALEGVIDDNDQGATIQQEIAT